MPWPLGGRIYDYSMRIGGWKAWRHGCLCWSGGQTTCAWGKRRAAVWSDASPTRERGEREGSRASGRDREP